MNRPSLAGWLARVLAAVINWNGGQLLLRCVKSLLDQTSVSLSCVVVDNASTDGSVDAVRQQFPEVSIRSLAENAGYAGGVNAAIEEFGKADYDYLFVANDDLECLPSCVQRLVAGIPQPDSVAVAGPGILRHHDGSATKGGIEMPAWRQHLDSMSRVKIDVPAEGHRHVDRILGCAILISRGAIKRLGGFDSRMFLNWEETDFCLRVWRVGGNVAIADDAEVVHDEGTTMGRYPEILTYYLNRNRIITAKRNLRASGVPAEALEHLILVAYDLVVLRRFHARAVLRGVADGLVLAARTSKNPHVNATVVPPRSETVWRLRP